METGGLSVTIIGMMMTQAWYATSLGLDMQVSGHGELESFCFALLSYLSPKLCVSESSPLINAWYISSTALTLPCATLCFIGAAAVLNAGYGEGEGDIYITRSRCNGTEDRLIDCPGIGPDDFCVHDFDAGVNCRGEGVPLPDFTL